MPFIFLAAGYHQHDYIVYPQEMKLPGTLFDQLRDSKLGNLFLGRRSQSNDNEVTIPTPNSMVMQSFIFYLESYMMVLLNDDLDYIKYFEHVTTLFRQHCEVKMMQNIYLRCESIRGTEKVSYIVMYLYMLLRVYLSVLCISYKQEMKNWLEKAISTLGEAESSLSQFGSSIVITCFVNECLKSQSLKKEDVRSLIRTLGLFTDSEKKIMWLMSITPTKFR